MRVKVYSTKHCGYCVRAKHLLARNNIPFQDIDVTGDDDARDELVERANGRRTVPVIFIDDEPIGGYAELFAMAVSGELMQRLEERSGCQRFQNVQ